MRIEIPFKTPSVNRLYLRSMNGRMYTPKEYHEIKKAIKEIVEKIPHDFNPWDKLKVTTYIYEEWFNLDGTIKKKDIDNKGKFLIDAVFDGLGLDDSQIFVKKYQKINEKNKEKQKSEMIISQL